MFKHKIKAKNISLMCVWFSFVNTTSIEFTCPSQLLTRLVAKKLCVPSTYYHCLKVDNTNSYIQKCIHPDPLEKGTYPILRDDRDDHETKYPGYCPSDRYQPQPMFSYERNECWYSKSTCTGEGQVVHTNGSGTQDRTCRCDYTKGFTFVTRPQAGCYCVPSEEDCSCYRVACPDKYSLTQGYECGDITSVTRYRCQGIICTKDNIAEKSSNITQDKEKREGNDQNYRMVTAISLTLVITIVVCLAVSVRKLKNLKYYMDHMQSSKKDCCQNIVQDLGHVTCAEGKTDTFPCEVIWYKDGSQIEESDNHRFCYENGQCKLTILKTSELYKGKYCVVRAKYN